MQIVKIFQGSRAGAVRANGRGASGSLQQSCNPERPMKVRLDCRSWWNWSHTEMQSTWFVACHSNVWSSHALNVEWVFEASASRCPAQVSLLTGWTLRFWRKTLPQNRCWTIYSLPVRLKHWQSKSLHSETANVPWRNWACKINI